MELEAWQAQSVRLTAFPVKPEIELQQSWWKELFGQDPDNVTSQPKQLARLEEGSLDSGLMVLKIQPGRINWQYGARLDVAEALKQIPTVSNFPDILQLFTPLIEKWFAICPGLERMAFGAVLLQHVEGLPEGYKVLGEYLRDVRVDPQTSDFGYQINKRRECISGIQGLQINRLMNWSVVGMKLELVAGSGKAQNQQKNTPKFPRI